MDHTVIILAGGRSVRMGTNKALMPYRGKPMIMYAVELAGSLGWPVMISSNNHDLDHLGFPVVPDIITIASPLAGIHGGLVASRTGWNLVLSCDMPHIDRNIIDRLMQHTTGPYRMVVPVHDHLVEPLCGLYHRDLIPLIADHAGAGKMSPLDLIGKAPAFTVMTDDLGPAENAYLFRNFNEKRDLEE